MIPRLLQYLMFQYDLVIPIIPANMNVDTIYWILLKIWTAMKSQTGKNQ